jgi:hypothetical protein
MGGSWSVQDREDLNERENRRVTQRDSFHLRQRGIPVARRQITTSASLWRGQDMLYSQPNYALFHTKDTAIERNFRAH